MAGGLWPVIYSYYNPISHHQLIFFSVYVSSDKLQITHTQSVSHSSQQTLTPNTTTLSTVHCLCRQSKTNQAVNEEWINSMRRLLFVVSDDSPALSHYQHLTTSIRSEFPNPIREQFGLFHLQIWEPQSVKTSHQLGVGSLTPSGGR